MKILCHRGYWQNSTEKNSKNAFLRGYLLGLGTETDIRDVKGQVVISHDPASSDAMTLDDFLRITPRHLMLALNVKSDGLAAWAREILRHHDHQQYFFFDMSIPDLMSYRKMKLPYAVRVSEYEILQSGLEQDADFIWLDGFVSAWYGKQDIDALLNTQKTLVVVSEELHGRPHALQWKLLHAYQGSTNLMLCTDYPEQAMAYFGVSL